MSGHLPTTASGPETAVTTMTTFNPHLYDPQEEGRCVHCGFDPDTAAHTRHCPAAAPVELDVGA